MTRLYEKAARAAIAVCIKSLIGLLVRNRLSTIYKIGRDGAAASFEGNWYTYDPDQYGATGNVDFVREAEDTTRSKLKRLIRPSEVFYDVGAHGGVYTISMKREHPDLEVHSFEPQPEELLKNLALNDLGRENVHAVAVGDVAGIVKMTTGRRSSNHVSANGELAVRCVRLDDFAFEQGIRAPDWVKIDIEGLELAALRGTSRLLRESQPTIICEINHLFDRFGATMPDFAAFLRDHGYSIYRLEEDCLAAVTRTDSREDLGYSADWNFWFVHDCKKMSVLG